MRRRQLVDKVTEEEREVPFESPEVTMKHYGIYGFNAVRKLSVQTLCCY